MDTNDDSRFFDLLGFGKVELKKNILTFRMEHEGKQLSFLTTFFSKDPSKCLDKVEQAAKKAGFRKEDLSSMMQAVSKILPDIFGSLVSKESPKNEEPREERKEKEMDSEAEREVERILSAEDPLIEFRTCLGLNPFR